MASTREGDALDVQQKLFAEVVGKCTKLEVALETAREELESTRTEAAEREVCV